jgi:hypothetical protein
MNKLLRPGMLSADITRVALLCITDESLSTSFFLEVKARCHRDKLCGLTDLRPCVTWWSKLGWCRGYFGQTLICTLMKPLSEVSQREVVYSLRARSRSLPPGSQFPNSPGCWSKPSHWGAGRHGQRGWRWSWHKFAGQTLCSIAAALAVGDWASDVYALLFL